MTHKVLNRAKELASTTGTGIFTLTGAVANFAGILAQMADNDTTWYCAEAGAQWEIGLGTRGSATTLARTTILQNSAGDTNPIDFTAAPTVFSTVPAKRFATPNTAPILRAFRTGNQTVASGSQVKVQLNTVMVDTASAWDAVNFRWRPQVPGWYHVDHSIYMTNAQYAQSNLYRNGVVYSSGTYAPGVVNLYAHSVGSDLIYLNGTDYIELYAYTGNGTTLDGGGTYGQSCYMSAYLVQPDV